MSKKEATEVGEFDLGESLSRNEAHMSRMMERYIGESNLTFDIFRNLLTEESSSIKLALDALKKREAEDKLSPELLFMANLKVFYAVGMAFKEIMDAAKKICPEGTLTASQEKIH